MSEKAAEAEISEIAIVDMGPLADGDAAGQQAVAAALRHALETAGFLILTNHGVPQRPD